MRLTEEEYAQLLLRRSPQPLEGPRVPQGTPEKRFMGQLIQVARQRGYLVYHTHDARRSAPGFPDLCLVSAIPGPGRCFLWEVKTRTGKLSMDQFTWLSGLDGKTIDARVVRPSDFADLAALLQKGNG